MPRKSQINITVDERLSVLLDAIADKQGKSIAAILRPLLVGLIEAQIPLERQEAIIHAEIAKRQAIGLDTAGLEKTTITRPDDKSNDIAQVESKPQSRRGQAKRKPSHQRSSTPNKDLDELGRTA